MEAPTAAKSLQNDTVIPEETPCEDSGSSGDHPSSLEATQDREGGASVEADERLVESEQRLRLALESGGLGSWDLDTDTHHYLNVSDIWKAHFGRPDADGISQDTFLTFLHPDDSDRIRATVREAIDTHSDYAAQYRCVWPDASVHWISAHGKLLYDKAGRLRRMVGVTQDITAQKVEEEERERLLAEALERADRDPLTGLLNHRAFQRRLGEEAARTQREGTALAVVMLDLDGFKFFNDAHGHAVGDEVLRQVAGCLQQICRPYDTVARFGGDEFSLLLPGMDSVTAGDVEVRLQAGLSELTFQPPGQEGAVPITASVGAALLSPDGSDRREALRRADERLRLAKTGGDVDQEAQQIREDALRQVDGFSMLDALVTAVDNKDRYTRRHSQDVLEYGLMIAREIGMDEGAQRTVAVAALLHDVGKIGVPDAILRKPGKLTDTEFEAVKQHPQMGAVMVSSVAGLEETLDAVRHHHERWDGGGYPAGLSGEQTPLIARLMAVADAFSAMTTDRPYRRGMTDADALAILRTGAGSQWDPFCVRPLAEAIESRAGVRRLPAGP